MIGKTNAIGVSQGGGGGSMTIYHVEQVVSGDTSVLNFTTYTNQASDNYWVYTQVIGSEQRLTLIPYSTGEESGMTLYHATQTISGDSCTLTFTDYNGETEDNFWIGTAKNGNMIDLYITGDNAGWENIQAYKYQDEAVAIQQGGALATDSEYSQAESDLQRIYNNILGGNT